ncbi:MAG: hypothetical protein ACXVCN_13045 [Bdellovibrio sp.]
MKRIIVAFVVALCLGCIFQQDMLLKNFIAPDNRVAAPMQSSRTALGDHYYYYILSKKSILQLNPFIDSTTKQEQPFFYQNSGQENIYSGGLIVAGLIDYAAKLLSDKWNTQVLLAFVLQAAFLFFAVLFVYIELRSKEPVHWVELLLFGFLVAFFCRGVIYGIYFGDLSYPFTESPFYYSDFFRLVNPQMSWAFILFYLALLIAYFKKPEIKFYTAVIVLSCLAGFFSIPLTVTVILGLGLYGLVILIKERKLNYPLLGVGFALLCSFLLVRYQMNLFYLTEKGQNLQTGYFLGLHVKAYYFYLLLLIPILRKFLAPEVKSPLTCLYVAALVFGSICDSFYLGSRIWLRGSGIFVHVFFIFALFEFGRTLLLAHWQKIRSYRIVPVVILLTLTAVVYYSLKPQFSGWYGYVEKDKSDVIEWFRSHAGRADVIGSPDFEDAYYIPQYTNSQPYIQLFDYSALPFRELINRYFQVLDMFGLQGKYLKEILLFNKNKFPNIVEQIEKKAERVDYQDYQTYSFYASIIYFPYNKALENIFANPAKNNQFHSEITEIAANEKASQAGKIDYLIYKKNSGMIKPLGYLTRFENAGYEILSKR